MNLTIPGKSLDAQFELVWQRFASLSRTSDSMGKWSQRFRRWLTPVNISFIVPIADDRVCDYLTNAQKGLAPYMGYAPQPTEKLHITLFMVGYLRIGLPFGNTWARHEIDNLSLKARRMFEKLPEFTVQVGPFNAFPNAAIAEVHDNGQIRLLERAAASLIPEDRRMPVAYPLIPHITLGFFGNQPAAPIIQVLRPLHESPSMPLRIERAAITLYYRGIGNYPTTHVLRHSVEEVVATLPLERKGAHHAS